MLPARSWLWMADGLAGRVSILMRQRYLVGIKLLETLSRGLFVLICVYRLPLEEAGRFGFLATVISLLSFLLGYERQIDLQRQVAGRSSSAIRRRMSDAFLFFGTHYLLVLPILVLSGFLWGGAPSLVGLLALVVVGEHFLNESYKGVLLDRRTYPLLVMAATKNVLQLTAVLVLSWQLGGGLTTNSVLEVWAVASTIYLVATITWWVLWAREPLTVSGDELPRQTILQQYRASALHFLVGLVAVAALQTDRLIVGFLLSASEVGIYFRHLVLAGLALQIFNIASFNRVAPEIYRLARENASHSGAKVVQIEYGRFAICLAGLMALALLVDHLLGPLASRLGLQAVFMVIMILGVLLRTAADYKGLLLLSLGGDEVLLRNQATAVLLGAAGLFALAWMFQLPGAFVGALLTPLLYLVLNGLYVQKRYSQLEIHTL